MSQEQRDVVIVGGGMVGLLLAAALRGSGLRIAIVEAVAPPASPSSAEVLNEHGEVSFEPRVSALTLASRRMLQRLGAWERIAPERIGGYTDMQVWDADGLGEIQFRAEEIMQPELGYIIENSRITEALRSVVREDSELEWLCPERVAGLAVGAGELPVLTLESGRQVAARLVVGADGANSRIRELAGLQTREWDYGHQAVVTTVRTAMRHRKTAWQRFMCDGPLAFLPMASKSFSDQYCSIVWSTRPETAQQLMAMDDAAFRAELGAALEFRLGEVEYVDRRFSFPLRQRNANRYFANGVALVGDAAHTIHPLAGQGVNLGMLDAGVLAEEILHGTGRGYAPGDDWVLRRYQRRRKGQNLAMMAAMEGFQRLFGATAPPLRWLRNTGMNLTGRTTPVKHQIIRQATGLQGDLPKLARVTKPVESELA